MFCVPVFCVPMFCVPMICVPMRCAQRKEPLALVIAALTRVVLHLIYQYMLHVVMHWRYILLMYKWACICAARQRWYV